MKDKKSEAQKPAGTEKNIARSPQTRYTKPMSLGLTNDVIFKYVFGAKESIPILIDLINAVLTDSGFTPIVSLTLKNPITPRAANWLKGTELDILAQDEKGIQYDIEMQISDEPNFKNRSLFYWARQYSGQLEKGDEYTELKPVICINLIDFVLVKNPAIFHSCYMLSDKNIPDTVLTQDLQIHFVELPKSREFAGKLADWARLLRETDEYATEEEMEVIIKKDEVMEEAYDRYRQSLRDKRTFFDALMREKWQRDQISRQKAAERAERLKEETERLREETERLKEEDRQLKEETERLREETERLKEEDRQLKEETERLKEEDRQLKEETERIKRETELLKDEAEYIKQEAEQRAVQNGARQKALEAARQMKADGMPSASIAKYTALTLDEIEQLTR